MSPLAGVDLDPAALDLRWHDDVIDLGASAVAAARPSARADVAPTVTVRPRRSPTEDRAVLHAVAALVPAGALPAEQWLTSRELAIAMRRGERGRPAHVMGRIAAKRALQAHLVATGLAEPDASRIEIVNDEHGCPTVAVRGARVAARHARVTIAHSAVVAVAAATRHPAAGEPGIGIDVEPIEPRSSRFERLTLGAAEQALTPVPGDDRDTWLTRLWAAKEAAAKASGRGLGGRPKAFAATALDGTRLLVAGRWIATEVVPFAGIDHVVALTDDLRTECAWHRS